MSEATNKNVRNIATKIGNIIAGNAPAMSAEDQNFIKQEMDGLDKLIGELGLTPYEEENTVCRKIDALIAEHVMGLELSTEDSDYYIDHKPDGSCWEIPNYSTDIAPAFEVMEKVREDLDCHFRLESFDGTYRADFHHVDVDGLAVIGSYKTSDMVPIARIICKAALNAKGIKCK